MNQEKIGRFLSELRKEQGMTQQQLADVIGVSNKTISKWECGKGMPELSSITPLCQTLQINVNELLSGERLPEEGYSRKAEENMMNLIHETEINKKKRENSVTIIWVTMVTVLLGGGMTIISNGGISLGFWLLDLPSLLPLLIVTFLFLLGTNLGEDFLQAFVIVTGKRQDVSAVEQKRSRTAVCLVSNTWMGMGIFVTCVGFIAMMYSYISSDVSVQGLFASISIALLSTLYGLIGYLLLLPIRMKLEVGEYIDSERNNSIRPDKKNSDNIS